MVVLEEVDVTLKPVVTSGAVVLGGSVEASVVTVG